MPMRNTQQTVVTHDASTVMSANGISRRVTQEDLSAVNRRRVPIRNVARNQFIIDQRTKSMHEKLYAKVQRREIERKIAKLDELMQDLLETQDPDNEELYDLYAKRKAMLETEL